MISRLVQVEARLVGEPAECERSLELLERGLRRWADAQRTVVGGPLVRATAQPVSAPPPTTPEEVFGDDGTV